jgi:sialate O-acetylesterase
MPDGPFPGGRRAAISLTYDDGIACHREVVAPALSARGLRGTFFCPANADDLHAQTDGWRAMAAAGHELGNHTCFHPCRAKDGDGWPDRAYDLRGYNRKRIVEEVGLAQRVLKLVDGRERRAYGATCGHTTIGPAGAEESFVDALRPFTTHVRAARGGALPLRRPPFVTGSLLADHATAAAAIAVAEPLLDAGGWLIVEMHGVGAGTHPLFVELDEHTRLLEWIAARSDRLWSATVSGAAAIMGTLPG